MKRVLPLLLLLVACGSEQSVPTLSSTPSPTVAPVVVAPRIVGDKWYSNGVDVEILSDEWGAGSCHAQGGARKLLLTNRSGDTIYSRRSSFGDPSPGCGAAGAQIGGKPTMLGPESIAPGASGTVTYFVPLPTCARLQVDDSWGPLGVFVVGDVFNSGRLCPTPTPPPTPPPCTKRGTVTAKATTNEGNYDLWDGQVKLVPTFHLTVGQSRSFDAPINGHLLVFKYLTETLASITATCPDVQAQWHGTLTFSCVCK